jgi:hypothetical protein
MTRIVVIDRRRRLRHRVNNLDPSSRHRHRMSTQSAGLKAVAIASGGREVSSFGLHFFSSSRHIRLADTAEHKIETREMRSQETNHTHKS